MHSDSQRARQVLESKLLEITNPAGWRDSIAVRPSADATDTTLQIAEREMAGRSLSRNASLARDLRGALNRLAEGAYGVCIDCEEAISSRRLTAVPWAARCLSCQESVENPVIQDEPLAA
jgi:DnaK suppressor protein